MTAAEARVRLATLGTVTTRAAALMVRHGRARLIRIPLGEDAQYQVYDERRPDKPRLVKLTTDIDDAIATTRESA